MIITDERLLHLAEANLEDITDMEQVVRECCIAIVETRKAIAEANQPRQLVENTGKPRMAGKPIETKQAQQCGKCHADVAMFISKTGKPYPCEIEIGEYKGLRQALSAANWFHNCGGRR